MANSTSENIVKFVAQSIGVKETASAMSLLQLALEKTGVKAGEVQAIVNSTAQRLVTASGNVKQVTTAWLNQEGELKKTIALYRELDSTLLGASTKASKSIKDVITPIKQGQTLLQGWADAFRRVAIVVPVWQLTRAAMQAVTTVLRDGFQFLVNWESKMAEIKIVGSGTAQEYENLSRGLLNVSRNFGIASQEIAEGAKLFVQAGFSLSAVLPLMETTSKISLLTGRSISDSVEDTISLMKNYKIEAQDTGLIVDKLVAVELKHAVTTRDLVEALRIIAPVATQANVSLEKMLGIITASTVATRRSGSEVARAWVQIFTRMGSTSIDAVQGIAKIPVYLDSVNNSTFKATGTMRSYADIFDEVAISWNTMGDVQQKQLAKSIAGVRQTSIFISAMQQWKEGLDATIESMDAFNKGNDAVNIILETTKNKATQLTESWHNLVQELVDTGALKSALSGLKEFLLSAVMIGQGLNEIKATTGQQFLSDKFKKDNEELLKERDNLSNTQQLLSSIISYEIIRNRLIAQGVGLDDQRIQNINEIIAKMSKVVAPNISGFGDIMKLQADDLIDALKSKQPELAESILSKQAETLVLGRYQEMVLKIQTLGTAVARTFDQNRILGLFDKKFDVNAPIVELDKYVKALERAKVIFEKRGDVGATKSITDSIVNLQEAIKTREAVSGFDLDKEVELKKESLKLDVDIAKQEQITTEQVKSRFAQYDALKRVGFTDLEIAQKKLSFLEKHSDELIKQDESQKKTLENTISKLKLERESLNSAEKQSDLEKDMQRNGASQLQIDILHLAYMKQQGYGAQALLDQQRKINNAQLDYANNIRSILISSERELNEIIGTSRLAILQRNLDVAKSDEEKLKARLEIEKEITKEKFGQASFTSREQKLFEIAQKFGVDKAQKVASIFQGGFTTQEVNESSVGGLFKKSFADEFKNRTMTEFFKKPENVGLLQNTERNNLQSILSEANRIKQVPDVNTNVQVYIDGKEITARVVKQVETEFKNPNSDLTNVATKAIKDKTGI